MLTNFFSHGFVGTCVALLAISALAETPKRMKAIVAHEYGAPSVLKYEDVPRSAAEG